MSFQPLGIPDHPFRLRKGLHTLKLERFGKKIVLVLLFLICELNWTTYFELVANSNRGPLSLISCVFVWDRGRLKSFHLIDIELTSIHSQFGKMDLTRTGAVAISITMLWLLMNDIPDWFSKNILLFPDDVKIISANLIELENSLHRVFFLPLLRYWHWLTIVAQPTCKSKQNIRNIIKIY